MRTPLLFDTFSEEAQLAKPTRAFQARERFFSGTKPIGLVFLPLLESPSRYWYLQLCKNQPWLDPSLIICIEWCGGLLNYSFQMFSRHSHYFCLALPSLFLPRSTVLWAKDWSDLCEHVISVQYTPVLRELKEPYRAIPSELD